MKIIHITTGPQGDNDGHDHAIYGLGDDGALYVWRDPFAPAAVIDGVRWHDVARIRAAIDAGKQVRFSDGQSGGWFSVGLSMDRSKTVPHPLDPTRHERA